MNLIEDSIAEMRAELKDRIVLADQIAKYKEHNERKIKELTEKLKRRE